MAAQFCMKCGQPLPSGALFCGSCGTPVPGGSPPAAGVPPPPTFDAPPAPGPGPAVPSAVPLAQQLGVQSGRSFLLQHLLLGPRHSYRVLDREKRHLFTIQENLAAERQEMWGRFMQPAAPGTSGMSLQVTWGGNRRPWDEYWTVQDLAENPRGMITLEISRGAAVATLADTTGAPLLVVNVKRGIASVSADAVAPDGRPMLEARGNLIHHNFAIHDGAGAEVAKIHEAWASVRDTYGVDLVGNVDPVHAMIFAMIIDHYKGK